jgi:outer membrane protein TolC
VRDAHSRAREAKLRLEAALQGEKSARGWVASVMQADAVGTASARDLADAYLAYFTLHSRVLQSTYEWNVALAALERGTGELSSLRRSSTQSPARAEARSPVPSPVDAERRPPPPSQPVQSP